MQASVCGDVVDAGAESLARSGVFVGVRALAAIQGCMILADDGVGLSAYGKCVEVSKWCRISSSNCSGGVSTPIILYSDTGLGASL